MADEYGFDILALEIMSDHIHLSLSAPPKYSSATLVKLFKGITARKLFKEFPELKIELNKTDKTTQIILGYITYHAGKLWNEANYLVVNKLAKPNKFDLYNKLKDASIHKKSLQSRTAQIVLDELSRDWQNFFKFLQTRKIPITSKTTKIQ